jgi:glyoxylase-like metal-dependent hydrolase (beta-lactamase superfamily II)
VSDSKLIVKTIVSTAFEENAYLAHLNGRRECLVVDPGLDPDRIIEEIESADLELAGILNTHGHADHIAGNEALKQRWPDARLVIGQGDAAKLSDPSLNLSAMFGAPLTSPPADQLVSDGEELTVAGVDLRVLEIPGHSVGHVVYLAHTQDPPIAFAGDVIFAGSVGRTDFADGSFAALASGIREKLYTLDESTRLLCGHGPETTVGRERQSNPFVQARG